MDLAIARKNMVDSQVKVNDVHDRLIQDAMLKVKRESLIADNQSYVAYAEFEPEISPGRVLMKPRDVAKFIQGLGPQKGETALCLAAPYAAAVLAILGLKVTAQESDARTVAVIEPYLKSLGVKVVCKPITEPAQGDVDLILCEGALTEVPDAWINALKIGGRLGLALRNGPLGQAYRFDRIDKDASRTRLFDSMPSWVAGFQAQKPFVL